MSKNIKSLVIKSNKVENVFVHINVTSENKARYEMTGVILENNFPEELIQSIYDFHQAIDEFSFSVVDIFEEEIQWYDLRLEPSGKRIFDVKLNGTEISFLTKFPTANGFVDEYPGTIE